MPSRDDPHTAPQARFLKALVREASIRGHLQTDPPDYFSAVLQDVKHRVEARGGTVRWENDSRGWISSDQVWFDDSAPDNRSVKATKGEVGQFIDLLTKWMPDMKPKHKRADPKGLKERRSVPPGTVQVAQEPGVECVLTVQLGLYERVPPERLQAVADLLKLWLQQTSLPVHGDPQIEVYPPREEADQQV